MLKKIPDIISPELMKTMMEMGHGDELVIADGNFPSHETGKKVIRIDGHGCPEILKAVLEFIPLDKYVDNPIILMEVVKGDDVKPDIWDEYAKIIKTSEESSHFSGFEHIERYEFYKRAKKAFAVIATGESAIYANIILKKGVVIR